MKSIRFCLNLLTCSVLATCIAQAPTSRTWVSGVRDDANPCSRTAPCKTFAGAISKTAAGGEIDALDPAGFGAVTIIKAMTIDGDGGQVASVLVSGTNFRLLAGAAQNVFESEKHHDCITALTYLAINRTIERKSKLTNGRRVTVRYASLPLSLRALVFLTW